MDFKEYSPGFITDLFPEYKQDVEKSKAEERRENSKALLKVLTQYPFILYQPLRIKTFDWLKKEISKIEKPNESGFEQTDYNEFQTIKFLLRRAALLGNFQVLEKEFLQKILSWFIKIDNYLAKQKDELSREQERNLLDFPIYVLRNYVEMIQKNGWVAYHLLKNLKSMKSNLLESLQGSQFLQMLEIESALVIDSFYKMITKEKYLEWRDMFKGNETLVKETDNIVNFFSEILYKKENPNLLETNKYLIVKETFLNNADEWIKPKTPFINYLWVKQLLFVDYDKKSYFPKGINYQQKIDAIFERIKEFFLPNQIKVFFIVTDGQQKPHVLKEEQNLLDNFETYILEEEKTQLTAELVIEFEGKEGQTLTREIVKDGESGRNKVEIIMDGDDGQTKVIEIAGKIGEIEKNRCQLRRQKDRNLAY